MALSNEMRRLNNKWITGTSWPKRLEWLEIHNIRGWQGQRVDLNFPLVALVGENGTGKSTVLQAAASIYKSPGTKIKYASDYFPDTPFERVSAATIRFSYREGQQSQTKTVRKPTERWRGNPERPERRVEYIDLKRSQPVSARAGYAKLLKFGVIEGNHTPFERERLQRLSQIVGKNYSSAGISFTNIDVVRSPIPVVETGGVRYSGFHQGGGEVTAAELIASDYPQYGLILIDEIETSLHPRAQRRLIRDMARVARDRELQIILTTHSPYVLEELPPEARVYLMEGVEGKSVVNGVSPEFAMTKMDEEHHPEGDVYVEDQRAADLVREIVVSVERDLLTRIRIVPYGAASVGMALGLMVSQNRFPRPSVVFLDGDQSAATGCVLLPGEDAPERLIFSELQRNNWPGVAERIGRGTSETIDALGRATALTDHHEWTRDAADRLIVGSDILWQALAASWATNLASNIDKSGIVEPIRDAVNNIV